MEISMNHNSSISCHHHAILSDSEAQAIIDTRRATAQPRRERKLTRNSYTSRLVNYSDDLTVDSYYVKYINDVLKTIRRGQYDYAFHEYQLKDILSFEPNAKISYSGGAFCISL